MIPKYDFKCCQFPIVCSEGRAVQLAIGLLQKWASILSRAWIGIVEEQNSSHFEIHVGRKFWNGQIGHKENTFYITVKYWIDEWFRVIIWMWRNSK